MRVLPPNFPEMSDEELDRFIANYPDRLDIPAAIDERKTRRQKQADIEADQKHRETIAVNQNAIRLSGFSFVVAVVALAISFLAWIFPRETHDTNPSNEAHSPAVPLTLSNTPATNAVAQSNDVPTTQSAK